MVLETRGEQFQVPLWRVRAEKLGLKLAVSVNTLRMNAVTGSRLKKLSDRCRSCGVMEIIGPNLDQSDQVVRVKGNTELSNLLFELQQTKLECLHIRVLRYSYKVVSADRLECRMLDETQEAGVKIDFRLRFDGIMR